MGDSSSNAPAVAAAGAGGGAGGGAGAGGILPLPIPPIHTPAPTPTRSTMSIFGMGPNPNPNPNPKPISKIEERYPIGGMVAVIRGVMTRHGFMALFDYGYLTALQIVPGFISFAAARALLWVMVGAENVFMYSYTNALYYILYIHII